MAKKKKPGYAKRARRQVRKAYKPAVQTAQRDVRAARAHVAPGGGIDQAYDRNQAAINQFQAALAPLLAAAQQAPAAGHAVAAGQAAQLGNEQAAFADQQAQLYGQTAKAAEDARHLAAAQVGQVGASSASAQSFLGALGAIQGQQNADRTLALAGRREEARTAGRQELTGRTDALRTLLGERANAATELAQGMRAEDQKFALAMQGLGIDAADDRMDFQSTMAGIREQRRDRRADQRGERADRRHESRENAADRKSRESIAFMKADLNHDGRLDRKDTRIAEKRRSSGTAKGGDLVPYYGGRDGQKPVMVSPSMHREQVTQRNKVRNWEQRVWNALTDGKSASKEEVRKRSGIRDPQQFELAWDMAVRRQRGSNYRIPRRHLDLLKAMFYDGILPNDLANLVDPPGKG